MATSLDNFLASIRDIVLTRIVFDVVLITFGTFLNLWFAASILTSNDLRGRLRNQLISNIAISHLLLTLIASPASVADYLDLIHPPWNFDVYCHAIAVHTFVTFIQSGVTDWLCLFLVATFVLDTLKYDPTSSLSPRSARLSKLALNVGPWLVVGISCISSIITLSTMRCFHIPISQYYLFETFFTVIPAGLTLLLLVGLYVLRRKQASQGDSGPQNNTREQRIQSATDSDSPFAYILALIVLCVCETGQLIGTFDYKNDNYGG